MNVLVIGATGQTGKLVVKRLVEQGMYSVTALARRPEAVESYDNKVAVIAGDATNVTDLNRALVGQDAVISTLGVKSLKDTNAATSFIKALLEAHSNHPINLLVNMSGWGAGGNAHDHYLLMNLQRHTILRKMYDDKDRSEALLFASTLPYVNVRPSRLTNGPAKGHVVASLHGTGLGHSIARADVAIFLVDQLNDVKWLGQSPLLSYAR